ncbi:MAG: prolyl oligopeptidase family serine peptidase [Bacteroidetes bacterium]|nr:prolyl oligopeptidase family serine peptidase [Bacteroidota bacterium]
MSADYILDTKDNEKIRISTFGEENYSSGRIIIHVHGFKGFKDWGFNPYIARYFAKNGYYVITFNFSHNGIGEDPLNFTELEKFAENTYSREVNELAELIEAVKSGFFGEIESPRIGVIGHSRGGVASLINGEKYSEIKAVSTWAAISKLDRYSERQKEEWKIQGYFEVVNTRTNQVMRLNYSLMEDIENNQTGLLSLEKAVKNLNKPLLIVHGEQDLAVPVKEGETLYNWSDKNKSELFIIKNTGHTFGAVHPFTGANESLDLLLDKTKRFFDEHLS